MKWGEVEDIKGGFSFNVEIEIEHKSVCLLLFRPIYRIIELKRTNQPINNPIIFDESNTPFAMI